MKINKIFGIGLSKTGTSSFSYALEEMGFKSTHYKYKNIYISFQMRDNLESGKKLLDGIEHLDAYSDFWSIEYYKKLDKQYPDSKFILTVRDMDKWLLSCKKHVERNVKEKNNKSPWKVYDEEGLKKKYNDFYKDVVEYFKGRKDDLLILDVTKEGAWERLCRFLGKPVTQRPFPHRNKVKINFFNYRDYIYIMKKVYSKLSEVIPFPFKTCY